MKKIILLSLIALFVFPQYAEAQMTITKTVPKYIYVQPELDYYEHMVVSVVADKVVKIIHAGKIETTRNENFAIALQRWEQEGWKMQPGSAIMDSWGVVCREYIFTRQVYKEGKPDKK